jgi:predicted AlkP superfamily phosphohydrolase/phosphomutase
MERTLLIGLDGATFTVLDPYMRRGVMPLLRRLCADGVRAPLRTIMPPLTPPAWTSLMTGKRPGRHGVFDFFQKESADSEYYGLATSQDIHSATIWSLASDHGRRVVSLNFPLMFPPPPVNGAVVPGGWMPWRQLRLGCHPPGLFDRLKQLPSFNPRELALDMELEAKAIEGCPAEEYGDWIRLHTRREERWFAVLRYLLDTEPADLVAVMFDGVDKLQHLCWRFIDPACRPAAPSAWEQEMIALCEGYFARLDAMLAELVELAGDEATVVVASDHGFGPTRDLFHVNRWLEQHGYLAWRDEPAADAGAEPQIGFAQMTRHVYELDWERTVAYAATPTSQGINIAGGERGEALSAELADALRRERNPLTGRPLVRDVLTRHEAFPGPYGELAPDLFLVLEDGVAMSIARAPDTWRRRPHVSGNHDWLGVLVARGPGVRRGAEVSEVSIVDVAPLVLYSLGVPIPDDLDGRLPAGLFEGGQLERRPPLASSAGEPAPAPGGAAMTYEPEEETLILDRLRALGYVE